MPGASDRISSSWSPSTLVVLAACTAPPPAPAARPEPEPHTEATPAEEPRSSPDPAPRADPSTKHCTFPGAADPSEQNLAIVLSRMRVPLEFTCPTSYRLVQQRPWYRAPGPEFAPGPKDVSGELFTFTGSDPASGDTVWVTIGHDEHERYADEETMSRRIEFDPSCPLRPSLGPHWRCVQASHRLHGGADPLKAWLDAHPAVRTIDWIVFDVSSFPRASPPQWSRVLHLHEDRTVTLCLERGTTSRCWRREDIDQSRLGEGGMTDEVGLSTTTRGETTEWTLSAAGTLLGPEDSAPSGWTLVDAPEFTLAAAYPAEVIHSLPGGFVTLGRHDGIGSYGGMTSATLSEWLLARRDGRWTAVAVPDMLVDEVVAVDGSLAVATTSLLLGDGPSTRRTELVLFADGERGPTYVGQLPMPIGVTEVSEGGEFSWRAVIAAPSPQCLQLSAGDFEGHTFESTDEDVFKRPITRDARNAFKNLSGAWKITPEGPKRGCG